MKITTPAELTLRSAKRSVIATSGSVIKFRDYLNGQTLTLTQGQLSIDENLTIDASTLSNGFIIDANEQSRVLVVQPSNSVTLKKLTLTRGKATGGYPSGRGGAIYVDGRFGGNTGQNTASLILDSCTLTNNSAEQGGAIFGDGENGGESNVTIHSSTLSYNQSDNAGGAIYNNSVGGRANLTIDTSTLAVNSASAGGAIYNDTTGIAALSLTYSTVTENSANNGGGIYNNGTVAQSDSITINNTILANNSASNSEPDLHVTGTGSVTLGGTNLLSSLEDQTILSDTSPSPVIATDPKLAGLGYYGGPTMTMHPLTGSPAILAGDDTLRQNELGFILLDQRGFSLFSPPTIGAVKYGRPQEVKLLNEDELDAEAQIRSILQSERLRIDEGNVITFSPDLDGETIVLTNGQLTIINGSELFIDASNLPNGLTIDADEKSRIFEIQPNVTIALHGLTLTGGNAPGRGGAINSDLSDADDSVRISLSACTLSDNSATRGAGISAGVTGSGKAMLTLNACTLSNNSVNTEGGGIFLYGTDFGITTLSLNTCTLSGNYSDGYGGGISTFETSSGSVILYLNTCTIYGNSAWNWAGGIYRDGTLNLRNTILAGNIAPIGPDMLENKGSTTAIGDNLMSSLSETSLSTENISGLIVAAPLLAPLGYYGGPTQTHYPYQESPAILTENDTSRIDQRKLRITGPPTIGSVKRHAQSFVSDEETLRSALSSSSGTTSKIITFSSDLNGQTITLTDGQLTIPSNSNQLLVDASNLSLGLTIDANEQSRVLNINSNSSTTLNNLTLTRGSAFDPFPGNRGGAIYLNGTGVNNTTTLTLDNCSLRNNKADRGGAIFADGERQGHATLNINRSTLAYNQSDREGGAIFANAFNDGQATLNLDSSTLAYNSASSGGAIHNLAIPAFPDPGGSSSITIQNSSITENSAINGGGIDSNGSGAQSVSISLENTILANNIASSLGPDLRVSGTGTVTAIGKNLMSTIADSTISGTAAENQITILGSDPIRLAPLSNYGGLTMTMHPLAGSPAIHTGISTRTGQRGFTLTGPPTIGAVKITTPVTVTSESTLRTQLSNAANTSGKVIYFEASSLNGETLTLTSQLEVPNNTNGLFVDASNLSEGLTIDANQESRVLEIKPNAIVALHGLTLTGGKASGTSPDYYGGAIYADGGSAGNSVHLSLSACTLYGNSADNHGGGIYSNGGNSGNATLNLQSCTITANSAAFGGGGVFSNGFIGSSTLNIKSCTISENSAGFSGGGVLSMDINSNNTKLSLQNNIIANNTVGDIAPDLQEADNRTIITTTGNNLFSDLDGNTLTPCTNLIVNTNTKLAPLGDYGGSTQTMPPLPNSPAIDPEETTTTGSMDQRGLPRLIGSAIDIGAVEYQGEHQELELGFYEDVDRDGTASGLEFILGTDYLTPDSANSRHPALSFDTNGNLNLRFGKSTDLPDGLTFKIFRSETLAAESFIEIGTFNYSSEGSTSTLIENEDSFTIDAGLEEFSFIDASKPNTKAFYRLEATYTLP